MERTLLKPLARVVHVSLSALAVRTDRERADGGRDVQGAPVARVAPRQLQRRVHVVAEPVPLHEADVARRHWAKTSSSHQLTQVGGKTWKHKASIRGLVVWSVRLSYSCSYFLMRNRPQLSKNPVAQ